MARPSKRTTLREVAEATGLSTAAVSYALRGKHVSKETEERVRQAAAELGYEADPIARALVERPHQHGRRPRGRPPGPVAAAVDGGHRPGAAGRRPLRADPRRGWRPRP
ncbi:LacI family DNA-binding transcriptional regulator [Streptomyces sp. GLT-R25]